MATPTPTLSTALYPFLSPTTPRIPLSLIFRIIANTSVSSTTQWNSKTSSKKLSEAILYVWTHEPNASDNDLSNYTSFTINHSNKNLYKTVTKKYELTSENSRIILHPSAQWSTRSPTNQTQKPQLTATPSTNTTLPPMAPKTKCHKAFCAWLRANWERFSTSIGKNGLDVLFLTSPEEVDKAAVKHRYYWEQYSTLLSPLYTLITVHFKPDGNQSWIRNTYT